MRTLAQNKYIHILQGGSGGGGVNSPQEPKKCKKTEALRFLQQILLTRRKDISCNDVDSDSCSACTNFLKQEVMTSTL